MAEVTQLNALEAAITWRDRALLDDQAVFADEDVWTMENLRALWVAITGEQVDLRRLESLGDHLREVAPGVVRLAAELFWVTYLAAGPACISHARKTDIVRTIYEWSGQTLPPSHPLLKEMDFSVDSGPGLFFNARRHEELLFLIKAAVGVKKRGTEERKQLLTDPWETGRMLDEAAADETPQLSQIVRHLLFPDQFEPIFTRRDKRRIVESFGGIPRKEVRRWPVTRLDEELASIRKQLQPLYGDQPLSFLQEPLISTWSHGGSRGDICSSEQRFWVEKSQVESRPDRQSGDNRLGSALWSPRQAEEGDDTPALLREIEQGDVILHLTDNTGITGVSMVAGEIDEEFVCPEGTPAAGQPGYHLPLDGFTEVTPSLNQEALLVGARFQDELRELAASHRSLFFNRQLTLNRGRYLSEAPEALIRIFDETYRQESNRHLPHVALPDPEDLPATLEAQPPDHAQFPLAQVLYGATGTGKTYSTIVRAVEICDGIAPGNHDQLMARYRELQAIDRIQLITFHPSFGYRDFIEDIRKLTVQDPESGERTTVESVKPGIFKIMAERARAEVSPDSPQADLGNGTIWKVTPKAEDGTQAEAAYRDLIEGQFIACPGGNDIDFTACSSRADISKRLTENNAGARANDEAVSTIDQLVNQMSVGDLVILVDGEAACRAVGRVSGNYQPRFQNGTRTYSQTRPVNWLVSHREPPSWRQIARKKFLPRSLYRLDASLLRMEQLTSMLEVKKSGPPNHVLIIDEIGRGDIAQIFGEMITLIEPDKRSGGSNPLSVSLPVSGEQFSVPDNLYLLGTLNSADPIDPSQRDILNRRFEFIELTPDASLIRGDDQLGTIPDDEGGRIDLRSLMVTINRRIEFLAGREHRLGQGFFMKIRSYDDLLHAIRARILPHLRALFDNDWRKIQLVFRDVLKDGRPNTPQVVSHEALDCASVLGFEEDGLDGQVRYWVTADRDLSPDAFRKVYTER